MTDGRGALLAVAGVGDRAQSAQVSRLIATELAQDAPKGSVLLTACRGAGSARVLGSALSRHALVIADVGHLDDAASDVFAMAAITICTFRADVGFRELGRAMSSRAVTDSSCRWAAVATPAAASNGRRTRISTLPMAIRGAAFVPPVDEPRADERLALSALIGSLG